LCGQRRFGESYAEELVNKHEQLKDLDIDWVFIGPLQTNKISKIMKCAKEIQSVGSEKHARYIDRYLEKEGIDQFPIYLQVNAGEEEQKFGMNINEAIELSELLQEKYPRLRVQGIMAIPPEEISKSATLETIPEMFYYLFDSAKKVGAGKLSLGMSQDLEAAIQVGSTCVRVGSDIFKKNLL
jgi:pyridoxal phosphate enzyme (YggS family)